MSVLETILAHKRDEVRAARLLVPETELRARAHAASPPRGFLHALRRRRPALIAEVKKASPSKGIIREDFDPVALAQAYERGGAACLSVLTDARFFMGSLDNLTRAREAVSLPVLRKDFVIDEYQLHEARSAGADAVLLIVAALPELGPFLDAASALGMDALVEVHDEAEMDRALAAGGALIGINNRHLATFETDLAVTERLAPRAAGAFLVSESGIFTPDDVRRVVAAGAGAVLVGESLMRQKDVEVAARTLMRI
jgi:indole-3-glycerol phosphate synthase